MSNALRSAATPRRVIAWPPEVDAIVRAFDSPKAALAELEARYPGAYRYGDLLHRRMRLGLSKPKFRWCAVCRELVANRYGVWTIGQIQRAIEKRCGRAPHYTEVHREATRQGLEADNVATNLSTLGDALGVDLHTLKAACKELRIRRHGYGRNRFFYDREVEALSAVFPTLDGPALDLGNAARELGISTAEARALCENGTLDAVRWGLAGAWRIPYREVIRHKSRPSWFVLSPQGPRPCFGAGAAVVAARSLHVVFRPDGARLVPWCGQPQRRDFDSGAYVGIVVGRQGGALVVQGQFSRFYVDPRELKPEVACPVGEAIARNLAHARARR